jgi:hypothetical protein
VKEVESSPSWTEVVRRGKVKRKVKFLLKMIGAFWNIRGLNMLGRAKCLSDFIAFNKLDFVGILE